MTYQSESPFLSQLKPLHLQVLRDLASGATVTAAAAAAGVHRTTVHSWCRNNPFFASTLRNACFERMSRVQEEIEALTPAALHLLSNVLNDSQIPTNTRLRAALAVIRYANSYSIDTTVLSEREAHKILLNKPAPDEVIPSSISTEPEEESAPDPTPALSPDPTAQSGVATEPDLPSPPAHPSTGPLPAPQPTSATHLPRTPRNQKCPCGSGLKFKKCCLQRAAVGVAG